MRYVKVLVVILLIVFGITFFIQNSELFTASISVRFQLWEWGGRSEPLPFYLLLLLAFLVGALITFLYLLADKIKLHRELKSKKNRVASLEQELSSLRNMSLEERQRQDNGY